MEKKKKNCCPTCGRSYGVDIELAKKMRQKGMTFKAIGEEFGVNAPAVYAALKRVGFDL